MNALQVRRAFDSSLAIDKIVRVRWDDKDGTYYDARAKVKKLNKHSVWVVLEEQVTNFITKGKAIRVPRFGARDWNNSRCLIPLDWRDNLDRTTAKGPSVAEFIMGGKDPFEGVPFEMPALNDETFKAFEGPGDVRWVGVAARMLIGRKIVAVRYMTNEEAVELGWHMRAIVLVLDDRTMLFPQCDDEGNSAGALGTTNRQNPVLPVLGPLATGNMCRTCGKRFTVTEAMIKVFIHETKKATNEDCTREDALNCMDICPPCSGYTVEQIRAEAAKIKS